MSTILPPSAHSVLPEACMSRDVVGIFWDMENVPVPSGIPLTRLLRMVRDQFGRRSTGLEFNIFCNAFLAEKEIISELLKENVTLLHVHKDSSKDKLRFMLKRFLNSHEFGCLQLVLICDDIDLLSVIRPNVHASAVSVIVVGNHVIHQPSAFGVGRKTSFSAFVEGLLRGNLHLTKQEFSPLKHQEGPYVFLSLGDIQIPDFPKGSELHSSGLSSNQQEGHSDADTLKKVQWTSKFAAITEEYEVKMELPSVYTEERSSVFDQKVKSDDDQANKRVDTTQYFSSMRSHSLWECASSGTKASDVVKGHQATHKASKERDTLFMEPDDKSRGPVISVYDSTEVYEHDIIELEQASSDPPSSHQAVERYSSVEAGRNVKSKLLYLLKKQKVVLLVSNPGSGSGLEAASCAQKLGHRVLSIQPTDTEARLCATYTESCRKLTNVDCWIFHGQTVNPRAGVVFTTASYFFQLFQNTGGEAAGFQTIIVDGINEDNIYQRVIMKVLLRYLQSGVSLIFCCRGSDIPFSLQEAFCVEADNILNCDDVRFPVHVIWKEPSQDKLCTRIESILEYCATESSHGDIVVFVTTVEDAFKAKASLELTLLKEGRQESFICGVMYAGMAPLDMIEVSSHGIWKVYFTVDCPDVTASVMRIRCIVDCGLVSTTDLESGVFVKEFRPICLAEAEERRSLAALHGEGTCYRLYSESDLLSSLPSAANNMQYLEDVVLRLLARNTEASVFLQDELPKQVLQEAKRGLQEIGAIDKKGQLTEVGQALCLMSSDPRHGKLILRSLGRLLMRDAVLLSTVACEDWRSAYKSFSAECRESVAPLSRGSCELSHLIELYKEWCAQDTKERSTWCTVNMLNDLFFEHWHGKATCAYSEFLNFQTKEPLKRPSMQPKYSVVTVGNVLSECFPNGLLQVTEQGCQHPTLGKDIKVSGFSSLRHELQTNDTAICWLFSRDAGHQVLQVLNACILPGSSDGLAVGHLICGEEIVYVCQEVVPIGSLIRDVQFSDLHLALFLEEELRRSFCDSIKAEGSLVSDVARERVLLIGTMKYISTAGRCLRASIHQHLEKLKNEDREAVLTPIMSPFERRPVRALVGQGGVVFDVISSAAFRTIVFRDDIAPVVQIKWMFGSIGSIVKFDWGNDQTVACITYRTAAEANEAYNVFKRQGYVKVEVTGQALVCRNKLAQMRAPFQIVVSLRHQGETVSSSTKVPVEERFEQVPCVKQLGTPNKMFQLQEIVSSKQRIREFASISTLSSLEKHVGEKPSVDIKSEIAPQQAERDRIASEWDTVSGKITKLLNTKLGPEMPEFRTHHQMSPDGDMKGFLFFRTSEAAEKAFDLLSAEQHSLYQASSPNGPPECLAVEVFMEGIFSIPQACFVSIEGEFLKKMWWIKQNSPKGGPDYEASAHGNLVVLKLRARDRNEFHLAVQHLNVLLKGININRRQGHVPETEDLLNAVLQENLPRRQDFPVHPDHVEEVIKTVAHPSDVYQYCKSGQIHLVGDEKAVRNVIEALGNYSKAKEEFSTEILDLVFEEFTLLRSFLASFGDDPRKFTMECGLCHAEFNATFKSIKVFGSIEAITKAKGVMKNLEAEKMVLSTAESTKECCSVCHLAPECSIGGHVWLRGWHRLVICGHLYCVPCLILTVKWATLPLTCFHEDCASLWVIADVAKVTDDDPDLLTTLARRSLQLNIAEEIDFPWRPCPIPECAFVWHTNSNAESQGIQEYGKLHVCPACTNPVCFVCQSLFHYGRPCRNEDSTQSKKGSVPSPEPEEIGVESRQCLASIQEMMKMMRRISMVDIQQPSPALPDRATATRRLPFKSSETEGPAATTAAKHRYFGSKPGEIGEESPLSPQALLELRKQKSTVDIQERLSCSIS